MLNLRRENRRRKTFSSRAPPPILAEKYDWYWEENNVKDS